MTSPFLSRRLARWVGAALAALAFAASAHSSRGADAAARMEEIVQRHVTAQQFTGAVLVAKRGAALFDRAYVQRNDQFLNAPYSDMTVPHAAGAMYSTTQDLWRWSEAIFGEKLLTPASRAKLVTPEKNNYALGVRVDVSHGRKRIEHGGSIAGFSSALAHYPEDGVTVVVLSNLNTRITAELGRQLAAVVFSPVDESGR